MNLKENLNKYNMIDFLENINIPSYIVDTKRIIRFWNKAAEKLIGYSQEEVVGYSCSNNVLKHIDRNGIIVCNTDLCPLVRSIRSGKFFRVPFAVYSLTKRGERIPVNVYAFPLKNKFGEIIGAVEMFEDATNIDAELKKAFDIQNFLLPKENEFVKFIYYPSNVIGGDFIYYNHPWIMLIDVSGHGLGAALLSTSIKIMIDAILENNVNIEIDDFPLILEEKSKNICNENYFTTIIGKIEDNKIKIISCGHPDPIVFNGNKANIVKVSRTFPIGMGLIDSKITPTILDLSKNTVLFYSDGITEMKISQEKMLTAKGLAKLFEKTQNLREIYKSAMELNKDDYQKDDISLVIIKNLS
ncbi:SpoIIE family protein phosphatase [Thermosipho melanesiensis]|uniref:Diguanylate cyclase n=2 Tax=Thermosipho melanesiensis TaxID=46541 RepID=A0ABN4V265_9BACT|nr:SpoIIE family protein phosphatase [Thermosipho melanesiensis]ABR30649.1 putative PAS/PAC sensor protein [Thermosipho melanesiensis BI429]APT73787.1 diguanylate cyclase [Thermosipho melanesiensis]